MKNKKNRLMLLFFCLSLSSIFAQNTATKNNVIEIKVDVNLETYAIVERFANPYSKYMYVRDSFLKIQEPMRPMAYYAFERYKNEDNSKIAKHMAAVIDTIIGTRVGGPDVIFSALIYAKPFPEKGAIAPFLFSHANLNKATIDYINNEIALLIEELRQFYIERKVGQFMKKHKAYYAGAVNEIRTKIPKGIVPFMTAYYRDQSKNKYSVFIIPSRAFTKGEWQANGPQIPLPNGGKHIIQLLSSTYLEVLIAPNGLYTKFGFDDAEWLQDITIHEFGHTFCQFDSIIVAKTNTSVALFSGNWVNEMGKQGYRSWDVCVNEHVVRLGEILIAEKMGDRDRANRLRNSYIKNKKFVFIPMLEKKMVEYENNPQKYPTFKAFLPELLTVFDAITLEERDKLLVEANK